MSGDLTGLCLYMSPIHYVKIQATLDLSSDNSSRNHNVYFRYNNLKINKH